MPSLPRVAALVTLLAVALSACQRSAPAPDERRPVRAVVVAAHSTPALAEFAGEVKPRVETRAGFQVAGRITQRMVDVGQTVKTGQPLATLDAQDYRLAADAANAALTAAQVDRDQQRADYKRFEELQARGFISQADLDRRRAALDAAEAKHRQADASAHVSGNQTGYAVLRAPHDAVVVGIDAEPGQVVTAGQSVVRLARTGAMGSDGEKEVLIGIPEQQLVLLKATRDVQVRLWAGGAPLAGKVREISPVADAATRTFPARITLIDPPPEVALGMTATVAFTLPAGQSAAVTVPLQALQAEAGRTHVWLYDAASQSVQRRAVRIDNVAGNDVVIGHGLRAGDVVVTAGVHQLRDGQPVKLLSQAAELAPAAPQTLRPGVQPGSQATKPAAAK